mmetsp:Transcript_21060/g.29291  ORF Transcript_21060/g.29291 Transcript_21060/m.29291 type:complete len:249 (+) Transcript_21060:13-759(+)
MGAVVLYLDFSLQKTIKPSFKMNLTKRMLEREKKRTKKEHNATPKEATQDNKKGSPRDEKMSTLNGIQPLKPSIEEMDIDDATSTANDNTINHDTKSPSKSTVETLIPTPKPPKKESKPNFNSVVVYITNTILPSMSMQVDNFHQGEIQISQIVKCFYQQLSSSPNNNKTNDVIPIWTDTLANLKKTKVAQERLEQAMKRTYGQRTCTSCGSPCNVKMVKKSKEKKGDGLWHAMKHTAMGTHVILYRL